MSLQSDYLEHLPGFAAILDRQGRYLWLSPGGPSDWLGQTDIDLQPEALAEIIGRNNHDFWVAPMTTQHQESRAFNGAQETWFVTRFAAGSDQMAILALRGKGLSDVQMRLRVDERLASVAQISAGIAHELNNPMAWLVGNLDFVHREIAQWNHRQPPENLEEVRRAIEEAVQGTNQMRNLMRQLRTFSSTHSTLEPVDMRRAVNAAIQMGGRPVRERLIITTHYEQSPLVQGDRAMLELLVLNLLHHVVKTPGAEPIHTRVKVGTTDTGHLVLEVLSNGSKQKDNASRFIPFHEDNPVAEGLEMALSQHIVQSMHGTIRAIAEPGEDTGIRVELPAAKQSRRPPPPRPTTPRGQRDTAGKQLMVIDDEAYIGSLLRRLLPEYEICLYVTASDALKALDGSCDFAAILCDVMMDPMTGIEFFSQLRHTNPEAAERVIFMTGGAYTADAQAFLRESANQCVAKPFHVAEVRKAIEQLGAG